MRSLIILVLSLLLCACITATTENRNQFFLTNSLDADVLSAYHKGQTILLYAYNDKIMGTEAYADWASYLNEFKTDSNPKFYFYRVQDAALESALPKLSGISEFSLFIKKGMPSYLYEDLIVEPQVYKAVEHAYNQIPLTEEDKAFLPDEISYQADNDKQK